MDSPYSSIPFQLSAPVTMYFLQITSLSRLYHSLAFIL